jgi:anti-sigma B factor antagonist/stage II sporulation protein AA (anti-sigma F factor antagonist)
MEVTIKKDGNKILVKVVGRLDTTNVTDFEKEIAPVMAEPGEDIELDCSEFDYISSSGLRIFLMLQKRVTGAGGKLVLSNMKGEIREVFDMTGFSSIFTIE